MIFQMIIAALAATIIYSIIGAAPGADETATIAPVILILILAGVSAPVVLSFFIAAIVSSKLIDAVPISIAGIPAGVMSTPMVEHAMVLKKHGLVDRSIRKIAAGALVGTIISIPVSFLLAGLIAPYAEPIKAYGNMIFFVGAILLALMSKEKLIAIASIIPMALVIQGLRHLYWATGVVDEGKNVFISFFLGITLGPALLSFFELLNSQLRGQKPTYGKRKLNLKFEGETTSINPLKILTKEELGFSSLASLVGSVLFILSPVGLTIFLGELVSGRKKDPVEKASIALPTMEALAQATYFSGTLIPLIALGIPLSPMAIGPANPLFNAPPVFTLENNMHHILSVPTMLSATIIGALIACALTYVITVRYSRQICRFVFKKIPHEAFLGLFFALVLFLAYRDAGVMNVFGVLLVGVVAGTFKKLGVGYGVLFMSLYSASWLVDKMATLF